MIVIVEGVDCAGKSTLVNTLSKRHLLTPIVNTNETHRFVNFEKQPYEWSYYVTGVIRGYLDIFNNFDNFIKDRFHISEYAYSSYFNRKAFYSFEDIEDILLSLHKEIYLVMCFISYEEYKKRHLLRMESFLQLKEFNKQQNYFFEAFNKSRLKKSMVCTNNQELLRKFLNGGIK